MPHFNRSRVRDYTIGSSYTITDYNPPIPPWNGSLYSSSVVSTPGYRRTGTHDAIADVVTPDYLKKRSMGQVIMNDAVLVKTFYDSTVTTITLGPHNDWGTRVMAGSMACEWQHLPVMPGWFSNDITLAADLVLLKAYARMNQADFQGLVSIAEFGKTVSLLAGSLELFYSLTLLYKNRIKAIRALRRNLRNGESTVAFAKKIHTLLGNAWLQYRFGWTPLAHDIENICKAYDTVMSSTPQSTRLVKRAGQLLEYKYSGTETFSASGIQTGTREYRHHWIVKVSAGVLYELREQNLHATARHAFGISTRDVPGAAWELIPFSFVIDRFLNVGDWLEARIPNPNVSVKGNWISTKTQQVDFTSIPKVSVTVGSPTTTFTGSAGTYLRQVTSLSREANRPLSSTPIPTVTGSLGFEQHLDHFELIIQKIKNLRI